MQKMRHWPHTVIIQNQAGILKQICILHFCTCNKLVNLPGWCWAEIQQFALVGSSSSLHSEACNALGASDGVIHSRISQEAICFRAIANTSFAREINARYDVPSPIESHAAV